MISFMYNYNAIYLHVHKTGGIYIENILENYDINRFLPIGFFYTKRHFLYFKKNA